MIAAATAATPRRLEAARRCRDLHVCARAHAVAVATLVALTCSTQVARAEQGLFVARLAGGISMVHPDMPQVGGAVSAALDYGISERLGAVLSLLSVLHGDAKTLGIGAGFRGLLLERPAWRIFLHVGPELLLVWRSDQDVRVDLSFRGGLGCEYLLMWGLGIVLELYGSTPMGLGEARILDAAAAGATLGLFMEF
jgi:hypothetical protein